jgi:hypothetical protein
MFSPYSHTPAIKGDTRHIEVVSSNNEEESVRAAQRDVTIMVRDFASSTATKLKKTPGKQDSVVNAIFMLTQPGADVAAEMRRRAAQYTREHSVKWLSKKTPGM